MLFGTDKDNSLVWDFELGHWNFFVIWFLVLGFFYIQRRQNPLISVWLLSIIGDTTPM